MPRRQPGFDRCNLLSRTPAGRSRPVNNGRIGCGASCYAVIRAGVQGVCPARLRLLTVQPLGSRALRSVAFGVVAVGLAYVAGFVLSGLQNPFALAAVFVLVGAALMYGPARIAQAGRLHPRLSLTAVVVVVPVVVIFLISPTYIAR
jgi:hypothetical protein